MRMAYLTSTQSQLLRSCLWTTIRFNSSQTPSTLNAEFNPFLVKHYFTSTSYIILVTDFRCVWFEYADKEQICIKDSQLGSGFEPEDDEQLSHLLGELKDMFSAQATGTTYLYRKNEDNGLELSVSKAFGVATIRWKVECTLVSPISEKDRVDATSILYDHITIPLLSAAMSLQAEVDYSKDIITTKEREILEATELLGASGIPDESRKKKSMPFSSQNMKDELKKAGNLAIDISLKPTALASKMTAFVDIQTRAPPLSIYDSSADEAEHGDDSERLEKDASDEMNSSQAIDTDELSKSNKSNKPRKRMQSPELEKALQKRKDLREELAKKQEESNKKPKKKKLF